MSINRTIRVLIVLTALSVSAAITFAQTNPPAVSPELNRGIELFHQGKYPEAAKLLKKLVKENKTNDTAWYYLGLTLMRQQKPKDAIKALETAVVLQPKSASAHVALGYALLQQNRVAVALHEGAAVLAIDPSLVDGHYISGVAYLRLARQELALKEAESILAKNPKFAPAYLLKSQALVGLSGAGAIQEPPDEPLKDRYRQAGDALAKYLELNPNDEDKGTWTVQLESLRFFEALRKGSDGAPVSSRQVTEKVKILSKPEPSYTERARFHQVVGTVVLRAVFSSDGTVKHIIVVSGLPEGLTERAVSAARQIKFVPAKLDGRPVSIFLQLEYNFNLY